MTVTVPADWRQRVVHDVGRGIHRLGSCMRDLESRSRPLRAPPSVHDAPAEYRVLFDRYLTQGIAASDIAIAWWCRLVDVERDKGASLRDALQDAYRRRPAGPASHPLFVQAVRTAWLECAALNRQRPDHLAVAPEVLLLAWLEPSRHAVLLTLVTAMPYWPVGLDDTGAWT